MKQITTTKIKKYREYLIEEEKSKNTIDKYMRDINAFTKWIAERELCKAVILEYKEHLKLSYAAKSVNSILSSLNSFFEFCEWHNLKVKLLKIQKQIFANDSRLQYFIHCRTCFHRFCRLMVHPFIFNS